MIKYNPIIVLSGAVYVNISYYPVSQLFPYLIMKAVIITELSYLMSCVGALSSCNDQLLKHSNVSVLRVESYELRQDKGCVGGRVSVRLPASSYHTLPTLPTPPLPAGLLYLYLARACWENSSLWVISQIIWCEQRSQNAHIDSKCSSLTTRISHLVYISLHLYLSGSHCSMFLHYTVDVDVICELYVMYHLTISSSQAVWLTLLHCLIHLKIW